MYLAIDVGATKTLIAVFSAEGKLVEERKIKTKADYKGFLADLAAILQQDYFKKYTFGAVCCALPGRIDSQRGVVKSFGNLAWKNVPVQADISKIVSGPAKVYIENDANLAGLYEAYLTHKKYRKVLYITLSTGIGGGVITDGKIDPTFADSEIGHMLFEHDGKLQRWEEFASGRALRQKYGMRASDINNPGIWQQYSKTVAKGLDALLAVLQPDVVIIGGSVGSYFEKFGHFLVTELKKYQNNMVQIPPIIKAQKAEEAVIYGCYTYIHQQNS